MSRLNDIAASLAGYDPEALRVELARDFILRLVPRLEQAEPLPLQQALGRVLAEDCISMINVPPLDNSAMDGYALRGSELRDGAETRLRLAGTTLAGQSAGQDLAPGECQRIMTGAPMPLGFDTVVPQELCRLEGDEVLIPPGLLRAGDNRRLAGEDIAIGQRALAAGRRLRPADIGLLASLGCAEVRVRRRLRVAILSSGDELRAFGQDLPAGCMYDSNRYTLTALLQSLGVEVIDLGLVRDDPADLARAFRRAADEADAVISSGGVSVGEADHTRRVMAELGEVLFWKIAMRPGRPLAIGRLPRADGSQAMLFGLPGNPVAVMVTYYAFVRDALLRMAGADCPPQALLRAASTQALRKKPGRTEYQRGIVSRAPDGGWQVAITGNQGSGILSSMSQASGLVVLGHEQGNVAVGEPVEVLMFEGLNS